ncbi:MarR family transcriptional regulator [Paraglaciecola aquimarina]|uniref:MarR family transcriptional regulator n=1 Tax=Paraglaciecola aquimarina TaxID=1235557 RepID=A0ABU3T2I5_9ALTE|nr:MarR family transcriptional regulator [Paraglaciecola aquimarina]MDU0356443.1 MarR family transcriptional regulator [Paraglaciecola aquimarina]
MELSEALFSLFHAVRNNISQQVKLLDPDLSLMHMKSLKMISSIEDCTGQKLADFMGRDKAQINRLIKQLVNQDLLIKTDNKNDGRSQILSLTQRGKDFITKFNRVEKQVFNKMTDGLPQAQLDNFIQLAQTFRNNLK